MKYNDTCTVLGLPSLHERRHELNERLSHQLTRNTNNCLHCLLPDMRDSTITNRLRSAKQFPLIFAKTNKFKRLAAETASEMMYNVSAGALLSSTHSLHKLKAKTYNAKAYNTYIAP